MDKQYSTVVLGGGESGVGAALLAKHNGETVLVSDGGVLKEKHRKELIEAEIDFEEGGHTKSIVETAKTIIKSPGIPENAEIVLFAKGKSIPIIGEIEYAAAFSKAKFIAITGSNGKTTTTLWIYHIMKQSGKKVGLAGNIGQSLARQVLHDDPEWFVVELSSFQLDSMYTFRAHIAILTNITPDHLDRYEYKFENYVRSKFRIVQNQTNNDYFVYFNDDPVVTEMVDKMEIAAKKITFSLTNTNCDVYVKDQEIVFNRVNQPFHMFYDELLLKGKHNTCNAMMAGIASDITRIRKEKIRESLADFSGVEHRLEEYLSIHGVQYINDSKATNINSTWYALESMSRPTVWIVGGVDKGNDYSELDAVVEKHVIAIVCLGVDNQKIIDHFKDKVSVIVETRSMEEAVVTASKLSLPGSAVLLSPTCASFDLFANYEDRGAQFKAAVRNL
ncbi:MAG: UDP-N-acetylmuramoyl-L-alanine--D-glutamate ligase [Salinivirgaceae bacterium]|nr:UDP-N-acetylmuramoyl-L-alanine--D-glutamate ligase [Salinivirgaceae bacterium]MDY0279764.1 UDP-N-acetylmuramoyl-L-alanine--D-glutamate ligase [Salinivirgaceae bacterium]